MLSPLREIGASRGALVAVAPLPLTLLGGWQRATLPHLGADALVPALGALVAFLLAAWWLGSRPRLALVAFGAAILGTLVTAAPAMLASPALALALGVTTVLAATLLWGALRKPAQVSPPGTRAELLGAARGAATMAIISWLFATLSGALSDDDSYGRAALAASLAVGVAFALLWSVGARLRAERRRALALWVGTGLLTLIAALHWGQWARIEWFTVVMLTVTVLVLPRPEGASGSAFWDPILNHPERLFVATFAFLCTLGTLLLAMPESSASGVPLGLEDSAFTAVSAVCVTGLSVVDVGTTLSPIGQVLLLLLIQAGGLGIMTFSTAAIRLLGRRMSMRHEGVVARLVSPQDRSQVFSATLRLVYFTLIAELIGAIVLWLCFLGYGLDAGQALWKAIFTAISAFCNAGFGLDATSLVPYASDPLVLHTVGLLIIAGGLAPAVVLALPDLIRRPRAVSPQIRLVVLVTVVLLVTGFIAYLALEWSHSLRGLSVGDKLHNAWFQSVTLRTAGFNSVDLTQAQPTTLLMMMAQMFIGGSPGGTAGGIKTTTLGLLILAVGAAMRGRDQVLAYGRSIAPRSIYKAAAVTVAALATVSIGLVVLMLTQHMSMRTASFEVFSAVGTVGLTIGGTSELDGIGKATIMACMFLGRVGSLTLLMFLGQGGPETSPWKRPEAEIEVA